MAVVPDFFAGALAVPITGALHIGLDTFGLALSGFFAASALGSLISPRIVPVLPPAQALATATLASAAALLLRAQVQAKPPGRWH